MDNLFNILGIIIHVIFIIMAFFYLGHVVFYTYSLIKAWKNIQVSIQGNPGDLHSLISSSKISESVISLLRKDRVLYEEETEDQNLARVDRYFLNLYKNRVRNLAGHFKKEDTFFKYVFYKGDSLDQYVITLVEELYAISAKKPGYIHFKSIEKEIVVLNSYLNSKNLDILYYHTKMYDRNFYGKYREMDPEPFNPFLVANYMVQSTLVAYAFLKKILFFCVKKP